MIFTRSKKWIVRSSALGDNRQIGNVLLAGCDVTQPSQACFRVRGARIWPVGRWLRQAVRVRYGIVVTERDPRLFAELAARAEGCGWDAVFSWETLYGFDPWVGLTAAAMRTEGIGLGTMLTPIVKYKPWHLASVAMTLNELSGGRVILPVGLGAITEGWTSYEADPGRRARAELMTESLDVMRGLWADPEGFSYDGAHYRVRPTQMFTPRPPRPRAVGHTQHRRGGRA